MFFASNFAFIEGILFIKTNRKIVFMRLERLKLNAIPHDFTVSSETEKMRESGVAMLTVLNGHAKIITNKILNAKDKVPASAGSFVFP